MKFIIPFFLLFTCYGQEVKPDHYLLWEISGNGLQENSYLFGSLHSNDKRIFNLSDSTYFALHSVDAVALETDVFSIFGDQDVRLRRVRLLYDKYGQPYSSSNKTSKTMYGDEDGMPQFLDAFFQQYAYNSGKDFEMLETPDFQMELGSTLEVPDVRDLKPETLLVNDDKLVEIYSTGDIYTLHEIIKTNMGYIPGWYNTLILERNRNMTNVLDSLMKVKSVFCAVGAGHLAGSQGMINLLRMKGYKVRSVTASFNEEPITEKNKVKGNRSYLYVNDSIRFHAHFPGKPKEILEDNEQLLLKLIFQELGQGNSYVVEVYQREDELSNDELAATYIASPDLSPVQRVKSGNNDVYYEGIADAYPEGTYWARLMIKDGYVLLLKAYGGNKFMNSPRAGKFFDGVVFDE